MIWHDGVFPQIERIGFSLFDAEGIGECCTRYDTQKQRSVKFDWPVSRRAIVSDSFSFVVRSVLPLLSSRFRGARDSNKSFGGLPARA